jgi:DNA processing protein
LNQSDLAYVTLALVPGIGRARLAVLLARFQSAESVLLASFDEVLKVPSISRAAATAIAGASISSGEKVVGETLKLGGVALLPGDERFPTSLKKIPDAPTLLFALGDTGLLGRDSVAIVGSRSHSRYGAGACRLFAAGASRAGLIVVSGLARGLDRLAHEAALDAGGGTVGVLGNGLGVVYPTANRALYDRMAADGCLLTEFPPGERPSAGSFPRRNRLISGLSRVTLVIEARQRSGALITADCALSQGKEVLAVPGPITSPLSVGCNRLIQHGAKPALGLRDLFEEYGRTFESAPATRLPSDLTDSERNVLDILGLGIEHVDDIANRLGGTAAEALAVLTSLEIRGLVTQEPGKLFRVTGGEVRGQYEMELTGRRS